MWKANQYTQICHTICIGIFQVTLVKRLIHTITFSLALLSIIQACLFIYRFDLNYFIQYGPVYFIMLYLLCCISCLLPFVDMTILLTEEIESWNLKCGNKRVIEKNQQESKRVMAFMIFTLLCGVVSGISFVLPSKYDKHVFYNLHIAEEFFPDFEYIFTFAHKLMLLPLAVATVVAPAHIIVYSVCIIKSQINIFLHLIETIDNQYKEIDGFDFTVQNIVRRRIRFCISSHIKICNSLRRTLEPVQKFVYPFQLMGVLLFASIVVLVFTIDRTVMNDWSFRIVSLAFATFIVTSGIAVYGQALEDISTDVFDTLMTVAWYKWNVDTQKLYLMLLLNSTKQFKYKFSENISGNLEMLVEFIKSIFTAMSIVHNLQKSKH